MATSASIVQQLRDFRSTLPTVHHQEEWGQLSAWIARVIPFLTRHCKDDLPHFRDLAGEPKWVPVPPRQHGKAATPENEEAHAEARRTNNRLIESTRRNLMGFMDGLVREADQEPVLAAQQAVSIDLLKILQNTQAAITDKRCFRPPLGEAEVHDRIEMILRCLYPDLLRKPPLAKPVANFIPDTGIPSINTLIEYKFLSEDNQARQIANEILADTRGYAEPKWSNIVFVIYETRRFKTIQEWQQLLKECGVGANIEVVVLYGEEVLPK